MKFEQFEQFERNGHGSTFFVNDTSQSLEFGTYVIWVCGCGLWGAPCISEDE